MTTPTPEAKPIADVIPDTGTDPADTLGDAGKKALTTERDARKAADAKAKELEAEISRLRGVNAATEGADLDALRADLQAEMQTTFSAQLTAAAIKTEAKGRVKDPSDVSRYPEFFKDVTAGDEASITKAVDELLKAKPYLAAGSGEAHWGDVGGGQRESSEPEPVSAQDRMARAYGRKAH